MIERIQSVMERALGIFFVVAGCSHFALPDIYVAMMPLYLPWHEAFVYLSGVLEVLGGLGVMHASTRRWAGLGLIALLVAVFPANVHVALNHLPIGGTVMPEWLLWLRLPFQIFFIQWVAAVTLRPPEYVPVQSR